MGYKEKICKICGITYQGWHNSSCCQAEGCQRLYRQVGRRKRYPKEKLRRRPKTCRKCGVVIAKGKQLCEKCRKTPVCKACGKSMGHNGHGQIFCHPCWAKLVKKEELARMLTQIQTDKLLFTNYKGMFEFQQKQIEELLERNQELRKEKQWLEEKVGLLEVEKDAKFN